MFPGFSQLELPELARLLRRTVVTALVVGAVAVAIALVAASPLAAVGIAIGLALAIVNLRFMDSGVAKVETRGETNNKVLRRLLGTKTVTRLAAITVVVIGVLLVCPPLAIGMVVGLVIFEILFVISVARAIMSQGPVS